MTTMYSISNIQRYLIKFLKPSQFNVTIRINEFSQQNTASVGQLTEKDIKTVLEKRFPTAQTIHVVDESGGCGAQFSVTIESNDFRGFPLVRQHRMVMDSLQKEVGNMHAIRIFTSVPKKS